MPHKRTVTSNQKKSATSSAPRRGIVLAGGGARGAYEAGVLAYIYQELPQQVTQSARFKIICGTSVGAIHACFLAATADKSDHNVQQLIDLWRNLRIEKMLRIGVGDIVKMPRELRALFRPNAQAQGLLINSKLLSEVVAQNTPYHKIRANIRAGHLDALAVSATQITSGKTTVFVDNDNQPLPPWSRDSRVIAYPTRIGIRHALASSAMPLLFPPIKIDRRYYSDGGLRQNTPLSPALRLGADRVLIIGVSNNEVENNTRTRLHSQHNIDEEEDYPGALFLLGKVVDALMLDRLDYDIQRLDGFNMILDDGKDAFGEEFINQISNTAQRMRGARYRHVDTLVIRPSRDIGEMAGEFLDVFRAQLGRVSGWMFGQMAKSEMLANSDLLSYLLFDGRLAAALIELGRADADAARHDLIEFFRDG